MKRSNKKSKRSKQIYKSKRVSYKSKRVSYKSKRRSRKSKRRSRKSKRRSRKSKRRSYKKYQKKINLFIDGSISDNKLKWSYTSINPKNLINDKGYNLKKELNYGEPEIKNTIGSIYDFKLIELEGCSACINAKKLINDKGYSLLVKKELDNEESEIIKNKLGSTYDFFPKIFKYNNNSGKYDFIGGYDKLKELFKSN